MRRDIGFGSSFILTAVNSISFPFPLSFLFGRVFVLADASSCTFWNELDREIEESSSRTIVYGSESSVGFRRTEASLSAGGSAVDVVPFC